MDERNSEMFDHHAELFSQIGTESDHDALKEFLFENDGLLDVASNLNKQDNLVLQQWSQPQQHCTSDIVNINNTMCNLPTNNTIVPPSNTMYNHHGLPLPLELSCEGNIPLDHSLIESLVKTMPGGANVGPGLDQMKSHHMRMPCHQSNVINQHLDTNSLYSERLPDDLLTNFNKPVVDVESTMFFDKFGRSDQYKELGNLTWNGAIYNNANNYTPMSNYNLPQQRLNFGGGMDKNGNCSNSDKMYMTARSDNVREVPHNIHRLSPSASVESNVHTPTTSYDSVSPMSSNQTPARSDESISPMGSSHTPLRMDDCMSPAVKTPVKIEDSSSPNSNRTPLRLEESYSPGVNSEKVETKQKSRSPSVENDKISNPVVPPVVKHDPFLFDPEMELKEVNVTLKREPKVCDRKDLITENKSLSALVKTDSVVKNKILVPYVSATRIDESIVNKIKCKRSNSSDSDRERTSVCNDNNVPDIEKLTSGAPTDCKKVKSEQKQSKNKTKTIYQSLISPDQNGIKLKIKLSSLTEPKKKQRKRKSKSVSEDCEDDSYGDVVDSSTSSSSSGKKVKKSVRFSLHLKDKHVEQSCWGKDIPHEILQNIFRFVVDDVGVVPSLVRLSSVCKLWNEVANEPTLWQTIDLSSTYIKQKCKIDRYFRWLLEHRLEKLQDLNLNGWKFTNITMILSLIGTHCTEIESIGLSGWQGLHTEHLRSLIEDCPRLSKLDLSDVSPESKSANSAVSQKSLTYLSQTLGDRLTQLILSNNTLSCLPLIISNLAAHCPNLEVLDLSNTRRVSNTEFALNIEQLQEGCPNLRVLRITNSNLTLATVPLEKQVTSPGFPALEELSIAGHHSSDSLRITSVMDDNGLERILKTSHKLNLLDVRGCTRVTDSSLVRLPAWDIEHLYLSGCSVTRQFGSGLELIAQKWCHSLIEIDLAWSTIKEDLDAAVMAFAEKGAESPLRKLNLCGSSISIEPVKAVLLKCPNLESMNLQSCRGLPRGIKRLYENEQLIELRCLLEKKEDTSSSDDELKQPQTPASTPTTTKEAADSTSTTHDRSDPAPVTTNDDQCT